MRDLTAEILSKYGLLVPVVAAGVVALLLWMVAHWAAAPAGTVSVLWGLVEYTKPPIASSESPNASPPAASLPTLDPQQFKLLRGLLRHQRELGSRKLIVVRDGRLMQGGASVGNVAAELFGVEELSSAQLADFERLMEGLPEVYLRRFPDSLLDNPFVVSVTEAGTRYVEERR